MSKQVDAVDTHTIISELDDIQTSVQGWIESLQRNLTGHHDERSLEQALTQAQCLGQTKDGKEIYLYQYQDNCPVMREIGLLREEAFRAVGEGTGKVCDVDHYDKYYDHIILWDSSDKALVGAYRVGLGRTILDTYGYEGFYTNTLFRYNGRVDTYLKEGIELGRSFVSPKYWGTRALDYLWYGIGAYLKKHPEIRYLIGPVSISNDYDNVSKALIVEYYKKHYHNDMAIAHSRTPFHIEKQVKDEIAQLFHHENVQDNFKVLKQALKTQGKTVPILYKHYIDLCEMGGVSLIDFNIDPDFSDCIDGLMMVEFAQIKPQKKERYMAQLSK